MRLSMPVVRALARPRVLLALAVCGLIVTTHLFYINPTALAASASRYFYETPVLDPDVDHIQQRAFAMGGTRPVCPLRDWHAERYSSLSNSTNVFLAINFYNNEDVLPNFFQELPVILRHLGVGRVYVSVYENGSTDRTREMLVLLQELLALIGVAHRVVSDPTTPTSRVKGHRIDVLANVRNKVLEPLYDGSAAEFVPGNEFDELFFMNDISFCSADMFELFYQKRSQVANQVCATDWMEAVIYDRWVLRDMRGYPFYKWKDVTSYYRWYTPWSAWLSPPLVENPEERERFESHLPMQVFSCWNGATIFDADAFAASDGIRFRMSHADLDDDGRPLPFSDKASECFLSSVDMWKRGRGKILLVPRASVSYDAQHYRIHRKDSIIPPAEEDEKITWKDDPPARVAMQDYGNWESPERWAAWDEQR